jgi:hypothetical protein
MGPLTNCWREACLALLVFAGSSACSGPCPEGLLVEQRVAIPIEEYEVSATDSGLPEDVCELLCAEHQSARPDEVGDRTIIDACAVESVDADGATLACSVETGCTG